MSSEEVVANGTVANRTVANGTVANGTVANGRVTNGRVTNGTVTNGTVANGTVAKGAVPNGTAPKKAHSMAAYRAPSLLQPHRARQAFADAHAGRIPPLIGYYCGVACPPIAKIAAQFGYDLIWIDWEHSSCNVETMTQMVHDVQFISEGKSIALVRVPGHDHAAIGYALDAGASIVVPQVDTVEQAKHIISAAKFGSKIGGTRSAPPGRLMPGLSDQCYDPSLTIWENLNDQAAIVFQIESLKGVNNLDAILTEVGDHIDSVWLGSLDCRVSMGLPGFAGAEPEWLEAVGKFQAALKKHNKPYSGLALGPPEVKEQMGKGRSFLIVESDIFSIIESGVKSLYDAREAFPAQDFSECKVA